LTNDYSVSDLFGVVKIDASLYFSNLKQKNVKLAMSVKRPASRGASLITQTYDLTPSNPLGWIVFDRELGLDKTTVKFKLEDGILQYAYGREQPIEAGTQVFTVNAALVGPKEGEE
jgi:hypothetical protein